MWRYKCLRHKFYQQPSSTTRTMTSRRSYHYYDSSSSSWSSALSVTYRTTKFHNVQRGYYNYNHNYQPILVVLIAGGGATLMNTISSNSSNDDEKMKKQTKKKMKNSNKEQIQQQPKNLIRTKIQQPFLITSLFSNYNHLPTTLCDTAAQVAAVAFMDYPGGEANNNNNESKQCFSNMDDIDEDGENDENEIDMPVQLFYPRPSASSLRRKQTMQKMHHTATLDTVDNLYSVQWDHPLGEGSYGTVYVGIHRRTGEAVAVKKIAKRYTDNVTFQREMDALLHLRYHNGHPHICALRENYVDDTEYYYLVLDLVQGGEMFEHLCTNGPYSEADAARLIREVADALAFMHGIGIVHGDLKPENLMLSSENTSDAVIKIVDFGCAQTIVESDDTSMYDIQHNHNHPQHPHVAVSDHWGGTASTPAYCPPEILEMKNAKKQQEQQQEQQKQQQQPSIRTDNSVDPTQQMNPSFDMWALGVILYIMLTGVHPFDLYGNASDDEIEHQILSRQKPPLRDSPLTVHLSLDALGVIEQLMQWNPHKRYTAHELLQNPWVRGETARTSKMADSDKRLSAYRKFKTDLEKKVFADLTNVTASTNDDDNDNDEVNDDNIDEDELLDPRNPKEYDDDLNMERSRRKSVNVPNDQQMRRKKDNIVIDSVAKRTSLIELAFHSLDPQHRGYVTTNDLKKLKMNGGGSTSSSSDDASVDENDVEQQLSFSGFSDLLAENMINRYYPKGHIVYHEGDIGEHMYFINSGSVLVYTADGFSKTLRRPGDFFGEGALLNPKKIRSASIKCLTPVHAIEINREYFEKFLASDMNIKLNLREKDKSRKRQRAKTILRLQQSMQDRFIKMGETLFEEGQDGNELYIIEEGKVDISVQGHTVFTISSGEMCGEHSLVFGKPRNTTARCIAPNGCKVHVLRSRDFFSLLDTHPSMKESIHDICLRREFQKALCLTTKHSFPRTEIDLKKAFELVDTSKSGYLELSNIRNMIKNLDPTYSEEDICAILKSLDLDESGKVSWPEFKRVFGMSTGHNKNNNTQQQ